jgi:hypothetical protein
MVNEALSIRETRYRQLAVEKERKEGIKEKKKGKRKKEKRRHQIVPARPFNVTR